jgi:hypothetical protein
LNEYTIKRLKFQDLFREELERCNTKEGIPDRLHKESDKALKDICDDLDKRYYNKTIQEEKLK